MVHAGLAQLEHLNLGWCTSIGDEDMKGLQHMTSLSNLQLSRTKVSSLIATSSCTQWITTLKPQVYTQQEQSRCLHIP